MAQPRAFAGVTSGDVLRDVIAALALISSLFMVWVTDVAVAGPQLTGVAAARLDVILITLLSLASLTVPYLGRAGVFGPRWSAAKSQDLRMLANAPYGLLVLVYLVLALVAQLTLGPALAFGLAGALLAAQPRNSELIAGEPGRDRRWVIAAASVAGLCVLLALVQIAEMFAIFSTAGVSAYVLGIVLGLANAALLAVVAGGILTGHEAWRRIAVGIGITGAVLALLSLSPQLNLVDATLSGRAPAFTLVLWIAFGAAASAPSVRRRMRPLPDAGVAWSTTARGTVALAIGINALVAVVAIIELVARAIEQGPRFGTVSWIIALAVGVIGAGEGVVAHTLSRRASRLAVHAVTFYAAWQFALGLVLVVIWSTRPLGGIGTIAPLIAFAGPAWLAGMLWLPAASRERFAALPRHQFAHAGVPDAAVGYPAQGADGAVAQDAVVQDAAATNSADAAATAYGDGSAQAGQAHPTGAELERLVAEASDPATPATRLHELAAQVPETRAALAANPSTYPSLVDWLGRLDDPEVDAALATRE